MADTDTESPKSILIAGETGHGKSVSLMPLADRKDVIYFNCESGKPLPFKNNFKRITITDPEAIIDMLEMMLARQNDPEKTNPYQIAVIDTVSFMMDMYESEHVLGSADTQKAWGDYGQFFPKLMNLTAKLDMFFIFLGHLDSYLDEDEGLTRYCVPVKGAMAKKGIESRFTTVLYVKKMRVKDIQKGVGEGNEFLNITDKEDAKGFKHVFLTDSDKNTIGGRIRTPMGMFEDNELYIDNNVQYVIDRLTSYYAD